MENSETLIDGWMKREGRHTREGRKDKWGGLLTNDMQMYSGADFRFRRHLTLVDAGVTSLHVFDLQRPNAAALDVERLKALVGYKCHPVHCENVIISHPYPGNRFVP